MDRKSKKNINTDENENIPKLQIFSNKPSGDNNDDYIGISSYVKILRNALESGNRIIGILSDFGAGKTTLTEQLIESYKAEKTKVIKVNLWSCLPKDESQHLQKSFLYQYATQISIRLGSYVNKRLNNTYGLLKISAVDTSSIFLFGLAALFFLIAKLNDWGLLPYLSKFTHFSLYSICVAIITVIIAAFKSEIMIASPKRQAEQKNRTEDYAEIFSLINEKAKRKHERIVIIFEDIDRAKDSESVKDFLTDIHKNYLTNIEDGLSFVISIRPEELLNKHNKTKIIEESLYSKIFDFTLTLQPINRTDLEKILEEYLLENYDFYKWYKLPVQERGSATKNIKSLKGIIWICYGENLTIRRLKKRLNYANILFSSLCERFPEDGIKHNIELEKCAIVAYLEDEFPSDFYSLEQSDIGEIIGKYIASNKNGEIGWYEAASEIIPNASELFQKQLVEFLKTQRIDGEYRRYFYNYPKLSIIRSYEEDHVYNTICYAHPINKEFDSILQKAIDYNPKIIIQALENIEDRRATLPQSIFENETLLKTTMNSKPEMISNFIVDNFQVTQSSHLIQIMRSLSKLPSCFDFHYTYSNQICNDLYRQLCEMTSDVDKINFRKEFVNAVGFMSSYYKDLYMNDLPLITAEEISMFSTDILNFTNADKITTEIIKLIINKEESMSTKFTIGVENLLNLILAQNKPEFNSSFLSPLLICHMKNTQLINEKYENILIDSINNNTTEIIDYIDLINSIPAQTLPASTICNISDLNIHDKLNEQVCTELLSNKMGLEYFCNMRHSVNDFIYDDTKLELFLECAAKLFELYEDLFIKYRIRFCIAKARNLNLYSILFMQPYPIIRGDEIIHVDSISNLFKVIDKSQISELNIPYFSEYFCKKERGLPTTQDILNFICNLQDDICGEFFKSLNFSYLSYQKLPSSRKRYYISRLDAILNLSDPFGVITYIQKTKFLDPVLETIILSNINEDVCKEYGKLLFDFTNYTQNSIQIIIKDPQIRKRPDYILKALYESKNYTIYIASLRIKRNQFIFEEEKIDVLGDVYYNFYIGKYGYKSTQAEMLNCKQLMNYIYKRNEFNEISDEFLLPFSSYPQTTSLLNAIFERSISYVEMYIDKSGGKLEFDDETSRKLLFTKVTESPEMILNKNIRKALYRMFDKPEDKKRIYSYHQRAKRKMAN